MADLRDLLNPVDDDEHHVSQSFSNWLGVDQDEDHYMGDVPSVQAFGINGLADETSQASWCAPNGDITEAGDYLQFSLANTLV